jgi:hypothetical protein
MGVDWSKQAIWWASTLASKLMGGGCSPRGVYSQLGLQACPSDLAIARQIQICNGKGKLLKIQRDANVSYLSERQKQVVNVGGSILGRQMHHGVVNVVARGAGRG